MSGSWWMRVAGRWWRSASRDSLIWGCRVGTSSKGPGWGPAGAPSSLQGVRSPFLQALLPSPFPLSPPPATPPPITGEEGGTLRGSVMSWLYLARGGGQVEVKACTPSRKACLELGEGNAAPTNAAWRHPEHQDWELPPEHSSSTHHPAPRPQPSPRIVISLPSPAGFPEPGPGQAGRRHPNISLRVNLIQGCSKRRCHYSHAQGSLGRGPS